MKPQTLTIGMLALLLAGVIVAADKNEEKAIAAILNWGGDFARADKKPNGPVVEVSLAKARVTDAGLKELTHFKQLRALQLSGARITDHGIKELVPLKRLEILKLDKTLITDNGLKDLAKMKQLLALVLSG